jgi:hypothetical protein
MDSGSNIALRDRSGLSDAVLTVSESALLLMSLFDGVRTCDEVRRDFQFRFGASLPVATLQNVLEHLDRARFLEGPTFESYYDSLLREYRSMGTRAMTNGATFGASHALVQSFDEMLAEADGWESSPPVAGLVAPHLDYPRGRPCYAAAYATLRHRPKPARAVILGTNHFGRATGPVATACDFATPLGTTRSDREFLEKLQARCGDLVSFELDHVREHSIELQVLWLQHLFGADSFQLLAVLCPDPCGPSGTSPCDGNGVDLRDFALALRAEITADPQDTLVVAGADLSHVGAAFGDDRALDNDFLTLVRQRDESALRGLAEGDAEGFRRQVAVEGNRTRICSAGCLFVLAALMAPQIAKVLAYHQAVDQPTQTCVTCAALTYVNADSQTSSSA